MYFLVESFAFRNLIRDRSLKSLGRRASIVNSRCLCEWLFPENALGDECSPCSRHCAVLLANEGSVKGPGSELFFQVPRNLSPRGPRKSPSLRTLASGSSGQLWCRLPAKLLGVGWGPAIPFQLPAAIPAPPHLYQAQPVALGSSPSSQPEGLLP